MIEDGDGPGVAIAIGGAGFPEDRFGLPGIGDFRPGGAQHFEGEEGGLGAQYPLFDGRGSAQAILKGLKHAIVCEGAVEFYQVLHGYFGAAEREGQAVELLGVRQVDSGAAQELVEVGMGELRGEGDGGDVPAARQGVGGADGAGEFAVEVFRVVTAEASWRILEDAERMDQALLEREGVDEGFQRGARASAGWPCNRPGRGWTSQAKSADPTCASTCMPRVSTSIAAALVTPRARFASM